MRLLSIIGLYKRKISLILHNRSNSIIMFLLQKLKKPLLKRSLLTGVFVFSAFLILPQNQGSGQSRVIDSLKTFLNSPKQDTVTCEILLQLIDKMMHGKWDEFNKKLKDLAVSN